MKIRIRLVGFFEGKQVSDTIEQEVRDGILIKELFTALDKSGNFGKKFFKNLLARERPPVILVNGTRISLAEDFSKKLSEGDELSILSPLAGGG